MQVADFVLSPEICVERKAVPDLIQSLDSGRLFTQAEAMCKHYSTPVLLIEFDPDKAFALQSMADIGDDIRANNVTSKLTLLLLHFPKLRYAQPVTTIQLVSFSDLETSSKSPGLLF